MSIIALVGAKGSLGDKILPIFISSSKIAKIHVLSRRRLTEPVHDKVKYFQVDYNDSASVEIALKGCQALVNGMGTNGDYEVHRVTLVDAAARVGVRIYVPSEFGVDPHVDSEFIRHPIWDSKKAHDAYAESKGLKVISIYCGLFLEHPTGGFQGFHGFFPEIQTWYVAGTGDLPLAMTSKVDIGRSVIELIEMALNNPEKVPNQVRIAGTNRTPREIVEIFNQAAKGRTHLKLELLSDSEAADFIRHKVGSPRDGLPADADIKDIYGVAQRVFRMSGSGGNLDFSHHNHNELVNPHESKWKWKTMEEYAEEVGGMPQQNIHS